MNTGISDKEAVTTGERKAVTLKIDNTNVNSAQFFTRVLDWGDKRDKRYVAEIVPMHANGILCNQDIKNQIHVKIYPDSWQLEVIVDALNDGRLSISELAEIGGNYGGKSKLYIPG